jgi:sugar lactone lactonase YvrE
VVLAAGGLAGSARAAVSYSQQTLFSNLGYPVGVAVDSGGDVFADDDGLYADGTTDTVEELSAGGGSPSTLDSTQDVLWFMATDAAGDVFVADRTGGSVLEFKSGFVAGDSPITIPVNGAEQIHGVAVDASGDLFVADAGGGLGDGSLYELKPQTNGSYDQLLSPVLSGLSTNGGVAVDQAGDVFVANTESGQVLELSEPDLSDPSDVTVIASGLNGPAGVAVDRAGNLYVAELGNGEVVELSPQGGSYTSPSVLPFTGLSEAVGVAVDQYGDVFASGYGGVGDVGEVVELAVQQSQSITWSQRLGPYLEGSGPVSLTATATSKLPVSYAATGPCLVSGSMLTLTGAGVCVVTASQSGNSQYAAAASVSQTFVVEYGFEGFITPAWKDTFQPGSTIPVWFVLTNQAGKPIPAATASALAEAGDVDAVLTGPGITAQTAACGWYLVVFECSVKTPQTVKTGTANPYEITAQENVGDGLLTAPPIGPAKNPDMIYFK